MISSSTQLTLGLNYYWQDKIFFEDFNIDEVSQDNVGRVDAIVGLDVNDGKWLIEAFGKNLTNETVRTYGTVTSFVLGSTRGFVFSPPRTYGLRLRYTF